MNDVMNPNVVGNQFDIFNYKNLGSVRAYADQQGVKWFGFAMWMFVAF